MNATGKTMLLVILCSLFIFAFTSCQTVVPIDTTKTDLLANDVMQTQTEIATTVINMGSTIGEIQEITNEAKVTGDIPKEKVITIIKYVDTLKVQNEALTESVNKQTWQIPAFNKSRIINNSDSSKAIAEKQAFYEREKDKTSIFFKWALIATGIALVLAGIIWLPKILKLIL